MPVQAASLLFAEADARYPYETGGIVLGYRDTTQLVIAAIIGPGPDAVHTRYDFSPDAEYQQREINRLHGIDPSRHQYLGDWHTHPNGSPRLSRRDKKTLKTIAGTQEARVAHPVMLLLSGKPASWDCRVFEHRGFRAPLEIAGELMTYSE